MTAASCQPSVPPSRAMRTIAGTKHSATKARKMRGCVASTGTDATQKV